MKRITLLASIAMLVVGAVGGIYARNFTYVDASGVLHDSLWLPISAFLILGGLFFILISAGLYGVSYLKSR